MNQSRTIILNILATHLRSLYALAAGLLTGRWMLLCLGQEAYGLFGLVGGLIIFISIFNHAFSSAITRYFAVAIGEAKESNVKINIKCIEWFSISLFLLVVAAGLLLSVSYPVVVWLIRHFLEIPQDRINDCVWVFRCSCITCFIGFVNVPFQAMYIAKQNIAELTIYSFVQTTAHLFVLWYFVSNDGDWLVPMAVWWCIQQSLPRLIQMVRAFYIFNECRIIVRSLLDFKKMRELCCFAWWQLLGMIGEVFRVQGIGILINKYLGAVFNATGTLATTISGHSQAFSNEVDGVFAPAIISAYGAKDVKNAEKLVMQCNKFSSLLVLFIIIPLCIEMDYLITLWLDNPPPLMTPLTICLCSMMLINKLTSGHVVAINASGKIVSMQICLFLCRLAIVALTWGAFFCNCNVVWYGISSICMAGVLLLSRILIARTLTGLSVRRWLFGVLFPIIIISVAALISGMSIRCLFYSSIVRVVCVGCVTSLIMIVMTWQFGLRSDERIFVLNKLQYIVAAIKGRC